MSLAGSSDAAGALAATPSFPVDVARNLLAPITLNVLRVSLGSRAASAGVEAHASLARASLGKAACPEGTRVWADIFSRGRGASAVCPGDDFDAALRAINDNIADGGANAHATSTTIYVWDHRFPFPSSAAELAADSAPLVIMYADLGDVGGADGGAAARLVTAVTTAVAASRARAVYRHAPAAVPAGGDATTWLAGFGVSLDIKSTEYKVLDDRAAAAAYASADTLAVDADGSIQSVRALDSWSVAAAADVAVAGETEAGVSTAWGAGVDWDALLAAATAPVEKVALAEARAKALASASVSSSNAFGGNGTMTPTAVDMALEPWRCADLGLQAAAFVMDAAAREAAGETGEGADPLAALVRITGNFPSLAPWLSSLPVPSALRAEAEYNTRIAPPGTATMTLNGIVVEASNNYFNLFSLFTMLRAEARTVAMLDTLPLTPADRRRVLDLAFKRPPSATVEEGGGGLGAGGGPVTLRLDMIFEESEHANITLAAPYDKAPLQPAMYFNNIEEDEAFAMHPAELRTLLQPTWQLHQLRRNIYNAIMILDLTGPGAMMALHQLLQFTSMRIPIRIGLALVPGSSASQVAALASEGPLTVDFGAPASSLQLSLLYTAASTSWGKGGGLAFLHEMVNVWSSQSQDGGAHEGSPPAEPKPLTVQLASDSYSNVAARFNGGAKKGAKKVIKGGDGAEAAAALVDASGALRRAIQKGPQSWVASLGVSVPSILFNGRVLPGLNLQQDLMGAVHADLTLLQGAVSAAALDDSVFPSVLHALVGRATVLAAPKAGKSGSSKKVAATAHNDAASASASASGSASAAASALLILPGAGVGVSHFHPALFAAESEVMFFPLAAPEATPLLDAAAFFAAPGTTDTVKPVSMLLIDDLSTPHGLASAAAMLAFARGDATSCVATGPAVARPAAVMLAAAAASLRLGLLHVPPLIVGGAAEARTVGDVVAVAAALIANRAPGVVEVRPDDAGPTLACVVDIARATLESGGSGAELLSALRGWLTAEKALPLRPRAAGQLAEALAAAFAFAPSTTETSTKSTAAALATILSAVARSADVAREMLPATLPATRAIEHRGEATVLRIRGLLANGRLLALRGSGSGAVPCGAVPSDGTASLGACVTMEEVALLGSAEASARGAAVVRQLADASFPPELLPGGDPDALTAEYMSGIVATAAAAVGASSRVQGASSTVRTSMRTELLHSKASSFSSGPRGGGGGGWRQVWVSPSSPSSTPRRPTRRRRRRCYCCCVMRSVHASPCTSCRPRAALSRRYPSSRSSATCFLQRWAPALRWCGRAVSLPGCHRPRS